MQILSKAIGDNNLSWKAKGILAHILSNPDHSMVDMLKYSKDSNTSTASGIHELEDAGYITRVKMSNGKMIYKPTTELCSNDDTA